MLSRKCFHVPWFRCNKIKMFYFPGYKFIVYCLQGPHDLDLIHKYTQIRKEKRKENNKLGNTKFINN